MSDDNATPITNRLLIALLAVGGLLVVAAVVIIVLLLNHDQPVAAAPDPTASLTPTPTPSTDSVQAPAPQQEGPPQPYAYFSLFSPGQHSVKCHENSEFGPPSLEIAWASEYAVSAWIWFDTDDAYGSVEIPVSGESTDIPESFTYPCDHAEATFTITLVGEDGGHVSKSWTLDNIGDVF